MTTQSSLEASVSARRSFLRIGVPIVVAAIHRALIAVWATTIGAEGLDPLIAAQYLRMGATENALLGFRMHPLCPLLFGYAGACIGSLEHGAYVVSVIASSLATIPLFFLVRRFWNEQIATWTVMLYALHPILSLEGAEVHNTGIYLFLFILSVWLAQEAVEGGPWICYPLAGLSLGLLYLTRPEGVVVGLCILLWASLKVFATFVGRGALPPTSGEECRLLRGERAKRIAGIAGLSVAAILVAIPYLYWIRVHTGHWALTTRLSAQILWSRTQQALAPSPATAARTEDIPAASHPAATPPGADVPEPPSHLLEAEPTVSHGWPGAVREIAKRLMRATYPPLAVFLVIGVLSIWNDRGKRNTFLKISVFSILGIAPHIALYLLTRRHHPSHRYFLPYIILLLPWAAAGLLQTRWWLKSRVASLGSPQLRAVLPWCPVILLVCASGAKTMGPQRGAEASLKQAGEWIRSQPGDEWGVIVSSSDKIAWYGHRRLSGIPIDRIRERWVVRLGTWVRLKGGEEPGSVSGVVVEILRLCKRYSIEIVAVDEGKMTHYLYPGFLQDLEHVGFEQVAVFGDNDTRRFLKVWILRLKKQP